MAAAALAIVAVISGLAAVRQKSWAGAAVATATLLGIGAAALAVVGIVADVAAPADKASHEAVLSYGSIVILAVAAFFLFSSTGPTIRWSGLPVITAIGAILIIGAYGFALFWMLQAAAGASDTVWTRYQVVFTAIQAVGTTGLGALFGAQAREGAVEAAKRDAASAAQATQTLALATPPAGAAPIPAAERESALATANAVANKYLPR